MSLRSFRWNLLAAAFVSIFALSFSVTSLRTSASVQSAADQPQLGAWGVDLAGMDTSVKPGDDFYSYVNGKWHASAEIPADKAQTGPAASLGDLAFEQIKALLEENAANTSATKGSDTQKIGDWYASLMDEQKLAELGVTPIQADLNRIQGIKDRTALADLLADNLGDLGASPLVVASEFDHAHVDKTMVAINIGGLSLPARDIYLKDEYAPLRKIYLEHLAQVFRMIGWNEEDTRAARVLSLETEIAKITLPREETRDPVKLFNPTPAGQLPTLAPGIDWPRFFQRANVGSPDTVDVRMRSSTAGLVKLIAEAPLQDWGDYCAYHLISNVQDALPMPFRDEFFSLYGRVLNDQPEPDPRWRVVLLNMGWDGKPLSDAIGRQFVERYVPEETRPQAREMVANIIKAFDARLARLEWMSEQTRAAARDKLSKTTLKLVYPDYWQNTDGMDVVRGDAIGNLRRAVDFLRKQNLSELTTYPDKRKFLKPVFQVNAYANPAWNEIVFLAAIIRSPFFDPKADAVVNYGAMGAVIGHEISHLFDDQGRKYDGDGLLRDWWTKEDADRFVAVAERLEKQISGYEPLPGKHVNGRQTLGESIADVAGLAVAYDAYRLSLNGKELPVKDGFTGDQRFFLAFAQAWRFKARDARMERLLQIDFHPPSNVRPQTVRNIDAWYRAFNIQPGDKLYLSPEQRVNPW